MLAVEHYELIRRQVIIEGKSQRDVAKELHHSRKTITKALALRIPPGYRLSKPRPSPVIEPVRHIIDAWLEQNKHTRPKQRQTGQRIYERLRDVIWLQEPLWYGTAIYQASSRSSKRSVHATAV
jgi:transposase